MHFRKLPFNIIIEVFELAFRFHYDKPTNHGYGESLNPPRYDMQKGEGLTLVWDSNVL